MLNKDYVDLSDHDSFKNGVPHQTFEWLRENGAGDLIKNIVSLNFGRAEDSDAKKLFENLQEQGYNVSQNEKVEPNTLKAFVREKLQKGQNVPTDLFSRLSPNKISLSSFVGLLLSLSFHILISLMIDVF